MCELLLERVPQGSCAALLDFPGHLSATALPMLHSSLPVKQDQRGTVEILRDILSDDILAPEFENHLPEAVRLYRGLPDTISEGHAWMSSPSNWREFYPWDSLMRVVRQLDMAQGKPALFTVPWLLIDYNKYFDRLYVIGVTDHTAYKQDSAFAEHIAEEGVESKLELDLLRTQRDWREDLFNKQNWQLTLMI